MKQFTATANDDGVRLSRFVQSVTRDCRTAKASLFEERLPPRRGKMSP